MELKTNASGIGYLIPLSDLIINAPLGSPFLKTCKIKTDSKSIHVLFKAATN